MAAVRVRFAPSPTGFLHVGGARTAIFNWLYARRHRGVFVLRVEDTDAGRSSEPMVQAILDGMAWLGLSPDEGPFFQSESRPRHVAHAERLLAQRRAYRCFCSAESLRRARESADSTGGFRYPRTCSGIDASDAARRAEQGEPFAVRFRVPDGDVAWEDRVHGPTAFGSEVLEDFVILRSDGTPTYQLSVVADDVEMRITHVIRGDDHISNTPKQILLYRALGQPEPVFAHVPLILGEDRKRLSKRHGAVSVLEYRDRGYLPAALLNFLALLGWSPGDDRQLMDRDELVRAFDLGGVGRSSAIFDLQKLEWMSGQYLMASPAAELVPAVRPVLEQAGLWDEAYAGQRRDWFEQLVTMLQPRAKTLLDFAELGRPYLDPSDDFEYEEKAARKHLKGEQTLERVRELDRRLRELASWEREALDDTLRGLAEELEVSAGKLIHPTRLAVTGRAASPGIFDVLLVLGRERTLRRLKRMIEHLERREPA